MANLMHSARLLVSDLASTLLFLVVSADRPSI